MSLPTHQANPFQVYAAQIQQVRTYTDHTFVALSDGNTANLGPDLTALYQPNVNDWLITHDDGSYRLITQTLFNLEFTAISQGQAQSDPAVPTPIQEADGATL